MTTVTIGSRPGNTFAGFADLVIQGALPNANNIGQQNYYMAGGATAADRQHILISVPGMTANVAGPITASSGSKITLRASDPGTAFNVALYKLLVPWVEAQATWNKRNSTTNWTTAGALGTSDVVSLTPIATGTVPATPTDFDLTGAGLTADFEAIVNGTANDYGYLLCADPDNAAASRRLSATEITASDERPFATLVYTAFTGPTVSTITGTTATEGSAVVFTVTMSGTGGLTAAYSWSGTAGAADYTQTLTDGMFTTTGGSGSVTVSGGNIIVPSAVTAFTVTVPTTGDTLDEANETIRLVFGGVTASSGTITDDDAAPTISVDDVTESAGSCIFTVSLSAASGKSITVDYATANGTRTAGVDYTAASGTLTFAAGETAKTVTVTVL